QGLGAAMFEKCIYDERGQLTNANMADYLVPMSGEMPDIDVGHVVSPTRESELGAKGAGEAGTAGAAAAVANAVNDALRPFDIVVTEIPLTPQLVLTALGRICDTARWLNRRLTPPRSRSRSPSGSSPRP